MRLGIRNIALLGCLIGVLALASPSKEWGKGKKQGDNTTVYSRIFNVPASHWEPNNITNYFADLEYTRLHIAEGGRGKCFHVKFLEGKEREIRVSRNDKKEIIETGLSFGKFHYVDMDGDGRLDLFHDNSNDKSFIITDIQMIRVIRKRTIDQDVQHTLKDKYEFKFQNGTWHKQ